MKGILIAVLALAVVGGAIWFLARPETSEAPPPPAAATPPPPAATTPPPPAAAGTLWVDMKDFAFAPQTLRVPAGTTVVWTNQDAAGHTVTSDTGAFSSALLAKSQSFERTFAEKGTFEYHCTPHPFMKASVIVE